MTTNLQQWAKAYQWADNMKKQYTPQQCQDYAEHLAKNCLTADMRILYAMVFLIMKMEESLDGNPEFITEKI